MENIEISKHLFTTTVLIASVTVFGFIRAIITIVDELITNTFFKDFLNAISTFCSCQKIRIWAVFWVHAHQLHHISRTSTMLISPDRPLNVLWRQSYHELLVWQISMNVHKKFCDRDIVRELPCDFVLRKIFWFLSAIIGELKADVEYACDKFPCSLAQTFVTTKFKSVPGHYGHLVLGYGMRMNTACCIKFIAYYWI